MSHPTITAQINRVAKKHHPTLDTDDATAQVWVSQEHYDRNCGCGADDEGWNGGDGWKLKDGNVVCINMYRVERDDELEEWECEHTIIGHVWFRIEKGHAINLSNEGGE